jgi:molybdenum cofactor cytidylyltransferase
MIAAIVLAAGASRRFGRPKQIVVHRGRPLVRLAVEAMLDGGCEPVLVIVGAYADRVARTIEDLPAEIVPNPSWSDGMASSIRRGVERAARGPVVEGVLLAPSDLPEIDADVVRRLLAAARGGPDRDARIAACTYAGTIGLPVVFPRSCFGRLLALEGDRGAKAILLEERGAVARVDWPAGAADIDRPADRPDRDHGL